MASPGTSAASSSTNDPIAPQASAGGNQGNQSALFASNSQQMQQMQLQLQLQLQMQMQQLQQQKASIQQQQQMHQRQQQQQQQQQSMTSQRLHHQQQQLLMLQQQALRMQQHELTPQQRQMALFQQQNTLAQNPAQPEISQQQQTKSLAEIQSASASAMQTSMSETSSTRQPQQSSQKPFSKSTMFEKAVTVPQVSHSVIESILEVNKHLIRILVEYQNNGWLSEPEHKIYQQRLHTNLAYLATMADSVFINAKAGGSAQGGVASSVPSTPPDISPVIYPSRLAHLQPKKPSASSSNSVQNNSTGSDAANTGALSGRSDAPSSPAVQNHSTSQQDPSHETTKPERRSSSSSNPPSSSQPTPNTASNNRGNSGSSTMYRASPSQDPDQILDTLPPTVMVMDPNPGTTRQDPSEYIPIPPYVGGPQPSVIPHNMSKATMTAASSMPKITTPSSAALVSAAKSITTAKEASESFPGLDVVDSSMSREIMLSRLNNHGDGRMPVRNVLGISQQYLYGTRNGAQGSVTLGSEIDVPSSTTPVATTNDVTLTPEFFASMGNMGSSMVGMNTMEPGKHAMFGLESGHDVGSTGLMTSKSPKPSIVNQITVNQCASPDRFVKPESMISSDILLPSDDTKPSSSLSVSKPINFLDRSKETDMGVIKKMDSALTKLDIPDTSNHQEDRLDKPVHSTDTPLDDDEDDDDYVPEHDVEDAGDDDIDDDEDGDDDDDDHEHDHRVGNSTTRRNVTSGNNVQPNGSVSRKRDTNELDEPGSSMHDTTLEEFFGEIGGNRDWSMNGTHSLL